MLRFLIGFSCICFSMLSFAQADSLNSADSLLDNSVITVKPFIIHGLVNCDHGHICCETGCECCVELTFPQEYDTTEIVNFENVTRYKVVERRRYALSYEKSTIQYLFKKPQGDVQKYYSLDGTTYYFTQSPIIAPDYTYNAFENGSEVLFDDKIRYFKISESGERLDFSFQTDEKITENMHRVSILLRNQRVFGLTTESGELNERGIGYSWITDPNEDGYILATQTNGITKVFDETGSLLFDKEYRNLQDIGGGYFKAKNKRGAFLVDASGNKLGKSYDALGMYSNGMISVRQGEKYGFINTEGKLVIHPQYRWIFEFSEDRAAVSKDGNKWGFIDRTGKLIVPFQFERVTAFNNERAGVAIRENGNRDKWGIIDYDGNYIVEPLFDEFYPFNGEYAKVRISKKGEGIINRDGKIIIECGCDINGNGNQYPLYVQDLILVKKYGENPGIFLKDKKGRTVKELKGYISGHLAQITNKLEWLPYYIVSDTKGKKGMIDSDGTSLIKAKYDQIYILNDSWALVIVANNLYVVDYMNDESKKIKGDMLKLSPTMGLIVTKSNDDIPYCYNYQGEMLTNY